MSHTETLPIVLEPLGTERIAPNPQQHDSLGSAHRQISRFRKVALVFQLSGINLLTSAVNGLVTVGLPRIASDLNLPQELFLWPASVYGLATGSTLLLAGSIADCVGSRTVSLVGSFCLGSFILGCGFSNTGTQLIVFRAIQGIALSLHLSSAVGIITNSVPRGRSRNVAFSFLGVSQCLGFSFGLVAGGILIDTVGWRAGWYGAGGMTLFLASLGIWALPSPDRSADKHILRDLRKNVDWVGAFIASTFMTSLSYLLAIVSTDIGRIREHLSIVLLVLSAVLLPAFVLWVHRQVRLGRPALIPNKLWKNLTFSSICLTILLSFGVLQSMEQYSSLFFQEIQELPALQTSLRILPSLVVGMALNLSTGLLVDKFPAVYLVAFSAVLCAVSPLLMALANPSLPYWYNPFFAQLLLPVNADIIFTVGLIIVSEVFPENTQAQAGAVFNTASQFGSSLGLAIMQIVSTLTMKGAERWERPANALLSGYRASFWTMFALMLSCFVLGALGLRKAGKVGLKRE